MKRRGFISALGGAALAGPIGVVAQQPAGVPRIGVLMGSSPSNEATKLDAFREALEKLGYIDGQTILIEVRYAMSQPNQFGSLARELVALAPSVIACVGRQETAALQAATRTIPIVFMQVNDPVEQGFVASLARPGGNTTGFTQMSAELDPKRLELLHEIAPSLSRAAFLVNPNLTPALPERFAGAAAAARSLGIALRRVDAATPADLPAAFVAIEEASSQALLVQNVDDTWLFSTSGGTDLCTAFVGGVPTLPVYLGELQARMLGASVEAWDPSGRPLLDEVGELVLTAPMPSMPLFFWGDSDGARYRESYFDMYPGTWRHGDWIKITSRGTAVIYGRSDSTINRGGVRMGTAEIYRAVLSLDEIVDALVVDVPRPGTDGWMPLFVVLRSGVALDQRLVDAIRRRIRDDVSPRHVPDEVLAIPEVPRTLSGKVLEVPVKRILCGVPAGEAASRESLANPAALDYFVALGGGKPDSPGSLTSVMKKVPSWTQIDHARDGLRS